jgi:tetratricopeptide (TPR) repeat protein
VGDLKKAFESYKTSLAINSSDAEVLINYGNTLEEYGDFGQAIHYYEKALRVDPNSGAV